MNFKIAIIQFIQGFKDSYNGLIKFYQEQKKEVNKISNNSKSSQQNKLSLKLKQRIVQSCILYGLFLLSCILIFNFILMPLLNYIIFKINNNDYYLLIHNYVNNFIHYSFSFVWIMPVFLLSKIFNVLCYQDIADCAFYRRYKSQNQGSKIAYIIADSIFSCLLQVVFLVQSSIFIYIPIYFLNNLLFHLHISLLYALYAFEYKWFNFGWTIKKRLNYIELKWPYFFGFGLSLSIITSLFNSYIINATLFAFLFPALLLSAIEADCDELNSNKQKQQIQPAVKVISYNFPSLHLFDLSIIATDYIFRGLKFLSDKRQRNSLNVKT